MYSKEESQKIKREFWIAFASAYQRKWLLYDTKIKGFTFKFYVDNKKAQVQIDIEPANEEKRKIYYEKIESLQAILKSDYLADVIFDRNHYLDTGKIISRIWVEKTDVSSNNKETWQTIFLFFNESMSRFEAFFSEYNDYIIDLELNT